MDLTERLRKLATGMRVADAIEADVRRRTTEIPQTADDEIRRELLGIIEVMFLVAAVDGEISEEEVQQLHASIAALVDLQAVPGLDDVGATLQGFADRLAEEGWAPRLRSATRAIHTPEARSFAFRLAAGVAFVDDFVASAEAAALESLANALHLDRDESQDLLREVHELLFG